jgi:hypothetical protein
MIMAVATEVQAAINWPRRSQRPIQALPTGADPDEIIAAARQV